VIEFVGVGIALEFLCCLSGREFGNEKGARGPSFMDGLRDLINIPLRDSLPMSGQGQLVQVLAGTTKVRSKSDAT
jgi:hypothetical protein